MGAAGTSDKFPLIEGRYTLGVQSDAAYFNNS
jgi:hypothetical protein